MDNSTYDYQNMSALEEYVFHDPLSRGVRMMMTILQLLVCLLGAVGNICMFAVILRDTRLRVWGNHLHLSLAVLHLIGCLCVSPLYLVAANDLLPEGSSLRKIWCRTLLSSSIGYSIGCCILLSQIALCRCYILVSGRVNMTQQHWSAKLWPSWLVIVLTLVLTFAFKPSNPDLVYRIVAWPCITDDNYFSWQITSPITVPILFLIGLVSICGLIISYVRIVCFMRRKRKVADFPMGTRESGLTGGSDVAQPPVSKPAGAGGENNIDSPLVEVYQQATRKNFLVLLFFTVSFLPTLCAMVAGFTKTIEGQDFIVLLDISWIFFWVLPVASPVIFTWGRDGIFSKMIEVILR